MKELSPQDFEHWDEEDDEGEKQGFSKPKPLSPEVLKLLRENNRKSFKQWQFKEVFGIRFKVLFRKGLLVRDGDLWRVDYSLTGGHEDQWLRFEAYDSCTARRYKGFVTSSEYLDKAPSTSEKRGAKPRYRIPANWKQTTAANLKAGDRFKDCSGKVFEVLDVWLDGYYVLLRTNRSLDTKRMYPDSRVWVDK